MLNTVPLCFIITRFNWTNSEEPYFILDTLDSINAMMTAENNSLTSIIFAVNQKGRSPGVILRELSIGEIHRHAGKNFFFELLLNKTYDIAIMICMI